MVTAIKRLLEYETLWPHQNYFYLLFDQGNPAREDDIVREKDLYYKIVIRNKRKALNLFTQIKRLRAIQFALNASFAGQKLIGPTKGTEYFI